MHDTFEDIPEGTAETVAPETAEQTLPVAPLPADPDAILRFTDVFAGYNEQAVLQGVNFSMQKGEFVYLIGRTGAGKSSILKLIYADMIPTRGTVEVAGYETRHLKRSDIPLLRRKLGIVFQDFQLLPDRNVADNVEFAMRATGWRDSALIRNRLNDVLMLVGLSAKMKHMPHQLSGGEQQRVVIARALINDPHLLIADEPTGNLDPEVTEHIMDILLKINNMGTAVLMATHEHSLLQRYPARILECIEGIVHER
ncbi:MAG: ATP-binding cassette domain-containing protein [Bacteroidetes bacterium]|nr:ATP-binding cassette domain-containing protein [Bacteroidota bacterium]